VPRLALLATVERPAGDVPVVVTHFQTQQRDFGAERNGRAVAAQVRYIPEMTYNRPYDTTPRRTSNHVE